MSKEILPSVAGPEFTSEVIIRKKWIDRNKHVNNARYLDVYEQARAAYIEEVCRVSVEDLEKKYGLRPMLAGPFNGTFSGQLFLNEHVAVFTAAESASRHIRFSQRIVRTGQANNEFHCTVYLVDSSNAIRRIPGELRECITQARPQR